MSESKVTYFRYTFIESKHPKEKPTVMMGEPSFENPCSYEAVEKVCALFFLI